MEIQSEALAVTIGPAENARAARNRRVARLPRLGRPPCRHRLGALIAQPLAHDGEAVEVLGHAEDADLVRMRSAIPGVDRGREVHEGIAPVGDRHLLDVGVPDDVARGEARRLYDPLTGSCEDSRTAHRLLRYWKKAPPLSRRGFFHVALALPFRRRPCFDLARPATLTATPVPIECMARPRSASGLMPVGRKQSAAMYPAYERSPWP